MADNPYLSLHVLIERWPQGFLRAWVIQEGQKGSQLLKGQIKDVDKAKTIIKDLLEKAAPGCELKWSVRTIEGPTAVQKPPQ